MFLKVLYISNFSDSQKHDHVSQLEFSSRAINELTNNYSYV